MEPVIPPSASAQLSATRRVSFPPHPSSGSLGSTLCRDSLSSSVPSVVVSSHHPTQALALRLLKHLIARPHSQTCSTPLLRLLIRPADPSACASPCVPATPLRHDQKRRVSPTQHGIAPPPATAYNLVRETGSGTLTRSELRRNHFS